MGNRETEGYDIVTAVLTIHVLLTYITVLAELEACQFRNRSPEETTEHMRPILAKYLPLSQNSSRNPDLELERKRDHYSHWTLRLAFSATDELRKRFARLETQLFRLRLLQDDSRERKAFIGDLNLQWESVTEEERLMWGDQLKAATGWWKNEEEDWFKVDWEQVPELVEQRKVFLKMGTAFVHVREQMTMVVGEFSRQLEAGLEVCLAPILTLRTAITSNLDILYSSQPALSLVWTKTTASPQSSPISPSPLQPPMPTTRLMPPRLATRLPSPLAPSTLSPYTSPCACKICTVSCARTAT